MYSPEVVRRRLFTTGPSISIAIFTLPYICLVVSDLLTVRRTGDFPPMVIIGIAVFPVVCLLLWLQVKDQGLRSRIQISDDGLTTQKLFRAPIKMSWPEVIRVNQLEKGDLQVVTKSHHVIVSTRLYTDPSRVAKIILDSAKHRRFTDVSDVAMESPTS